jgi:hypothetical protein
MRRHVTVAAALVLFGCDKKDEGPGISIEAAPQEIAKAVCPKAYTCCAPMQLMGNDLAGKDEASCESKTTEGFKKNLDGLEGSIKKGRARYHGDQMEACLAFIRGASCEQLNRTNHFSGLGCPAYVEPLVAAGGACGADVECIEGTCDKSGGGSEGVCKPLPGQGEACAGVRCAKGLVCDGAVNQCQPDLPERAAPRSNQCFYASACAYGRGQPGGLAIVVLALLIASRRRRRGVLGLT